MAINERRVIGIILDECDTTEERCAGYREMLLDTIAEIVAAEYRHKVQGTNIQQKIDDQCSAAGRFLAEQRRRSVSKGRA